MKKVWWYSQGSGFTPWMNPFCIGHMWAYGPGNYEACPHDGRPAKVFTTPYDCEGYIHGMYDTGKLDERELDSYAIGYGS